MIQQIILDSMSLLQSVEAPLEAVSHDDEKDRKFIMSFIFDVCHDICKRGYRTNYPRVFDAIYEHIQEDIDKYRLQDEGDI